MMVKKHTTPKATVTLLYYDWGVQCVIENFEKLNARQIQQGVEVALREWASQQRDAVLAERRRQAEQRSEQYAS